MSLLTSVTKDAPQLPSRVVLYAPEKAGKTSFGCHAPDPIFLMTAGETGLLSLIESGQVPPTAHFPNDFSDWDTLASAVQALTLDDHPYKTLVLDTGNGAEAMCAAGVCRSHFGGDWKEYHDYGRGVKETIPVWAEFLRQLDQLRVRRKMAVLFLHHSAVKQQSNPTGKDWDQWRPEAIDKLWSLTHKWADVIAFYGLRVNVNKDEKAYGQEQRYLRCSPSAQIVAGNRYGMPDEITAPAGARNLWAAFAKALGAAKAKARQTAASPPPLPVQTPAPPPPPAPPAQQPEGEQGSDPRPATPTPTDPTTAPTAPPAGNSSPTATATTTPTEPRAVSAIVQRLIELMAGAGIDWPLIRDGRGVAEGVHDACGLGRADKVTDLTAAEGLRLKAWLQEKKAEKDARKRKKPEAAGVGE